MFERDPSPPLLASPGHLLHAFHQHIDCNLRDAQHGLGQLAQGAQRAWAAACGQRQLAPTLNTRASSAHTQLGHPRGRRIAFPRPFCSLTEAALAKMPQPRLVRMAPEGGLRVPGKQSVLQGSEEGAGGPEEPEERILISEVEVKGVDGELLRVAQEALTMRPNFAYTVSEVKADLARVFDTGWFDTCTPDTLDTRDGVKLIIQVRPNPELRSITASGASVLPTKVVQDAFLGLHGNTLNFVKFKRAVQTLDRWYHDRGFMGQVTDFTFQDGVVNIVMAEAVVGKIELNFLDPKTKQTKAEPSRGIWKWWDNLNRTRPEAVLRHLTTAPGQVYNLRTARRDINAVYSTGLFEDVNIVPKEADDSTELEPKLDLTINLQERKTSGLGAGGGFSAQARGEGGALPGLVGSASFSEKNLFGMNQKLSAVVEWGQVDKTFRLQHSDPWVNSDRHRTSRTMQLLTNRTSGAAIHGRVEPEPGEEAAAGGSGAGASGEASASASAAGAGSVLVSKLLGGIDYRRPLASHWTGTLGLQWQRCRLLGDHNLPLTRDCYGSPLTFSGKAHDTALVAQTSAAYSNPLDESSLLFSLEQSAPLQRDWLRFSRVRLRADKPLRMGPLLTLYLRGRAGTLLGDLPPYEAFPIGGTNSVRGYAEGGVGSGRHVVEGTAELRCPLIAPCHGTLFADVGSDLDSGASVIGDPAGARGKPGRGYGYGGGVRIDSPLGPLRLEYAWNQRKQGRFHVGLGYE